ncbi:MAG TPA: flagellar export chaperone FliS [Gammaproteobacteria bacterium]|nr:flagellar export chaperone FliS [Gammaproteobacteria bacterium]
MSYGNMRDALKQYSQVKVRSGVEGATPHRLIQMLMEGALEKMQLAKANLERGNKAEKARHIDWALSIIDGLQSSLDMEKGGQIAANLDALYDYMQRQLVMANLDNDVAKLDEVSNLLLEIKTAWDAVPAVLKQQEAAGAQAATAAVNHAAAG